MDNISDHIQSAGRIVLDMMEREWEPLCQSELEQRLDQAVEEMLEADLIAKVRAETSATLYLQLVPSQTQRSQTHTELQVSSTSTEALQVSSPPSAPELEATTVSASPEEEEPGFQEDTDTVDSNAIKHIADLLQNSKSNHHNRLRLAGRARLSLSHTVLLSLTLLSKRITYRSVSNRFRLEKGNIHRIFFSFCERVNMLEKEQISWPVEGEFAAFPLTNLLGKSERLENQCVPMVLGVLGHTHIPIRLTRGGQDMESTVPEVKRMKKEAHPDSWLNLELVCDGKGRFMHCRISKGSDMDKASTLRDRLEQHPELMPPGSCLVARAGYPLAAQILTPYIACHGARENLFNNTLEDHFNILDQAIANLKARFQRLRHLDTGNYERARAVVLTTCILHNVFLDIGLVVKGEVEEEGSIQEGEGEVDDGGINRREAISDLLYKEFDSQRI